MKKTNKLLPAAFLVLALFFVNFADAGTAAESPRQAVERLYKFVFSKDQNPREKELPQIRGDLDPKLYKSLMAAFNLPEAGLDFVPFTSAQDTVGAYHVGTPVLQGSEAIVPVSFGKAPASAVKIELHLAGEKWLVQDVWYPATKEIPESRLSRILASLLGQ